MIGSIRQWTIRPVINAGKMLLVAQLAFRKQEIRIMVTGKDVVEQKHHPNLGQSGHASAHDPHLPPYHAPCKILSWGAQ
ncbi:hypothetical protein HKD37_02G004378 [Glycine soja]